MGALVNTLRAAWIEFSAAVLLPAAPEKINDRICALRGPARRPFGKRFGLRETAHGGPIHPESLGDRAVGQSLLMQFLHLRIAFQILADQAPARSIRPRSWLP